MRSDSKIADAMANRDPRIDAYIQKSPEYAKPILDYFRDIVHSAVPGVEEKIRWSAPSFDYEGPLCGMAAFKSYCAFHFWKAPLLGTEEIGRVASIEDLPPKKELVATVKKAARLNEQGVKVTRPKKSPKPEAKTPPDLTAALKKNTKASAAFQNFSPSHRREYVEWITGAKSDETRKRRVEQAIEWIAEGKPRNWKYMKR